MKESLRRNIRLPLPDHEAMAGCLCELTRTKSDSSALTVDFPVLFNHDNTRPGPSTVWTNEKHRLYLDELEASFVNQLYSSIGLGGSLHETIWGPYSSQELPTNGLNYSHQFKVLGNGCWQINFERNEPLLESTADSHFIQENPWRHHYTSTEKQHTLSSYDFPEHNASYGKGVHVKGTSTFSCGSARSSEQHRACCPFHQNFVDSTIIEVSDQNFVDDDQEEKSSCFPMAKRLKTVGSHSSSNDQVKCRIKPVLCHLGSLTQEKFQPLDKASSEREEQVHLELLSENPENFVCPKSDLHYFLRGSQVFLGIGVCKLPDLNTQKDRREAMDFHERERGNVQLLASSS